MVDALTAKHSGMFDKSFRPREEHKEELATHGIESHGVVCQDAAGKMLWKFGDHNMSQEQLDEGLAVVLAKLKKG
ncbi:MAG: hypothetical protein AAF628_07945 [Planctomycetota bacterium]